MSFFSKSLIVLGFSGVVFLSGCGNTSKPMLSAPSPSPSLAILETPDEVAIELPPSPLLQQIPPVSSPDPIQTLSVSE